MQLARNWVIIISFNFQLLEKKRNELAQHFHRLKNCLAKRKAKNLLRIFFGQGELKSETEHVFELTDLNNNKSEIVVAGRKKHLLFMDKNNI